MLLMFDEVRALRPLHTVIVFRFSTALILPPNHVLSMHAWIMLYINLRPFDKIN